MGNLSFELSSYNVNLDRVQQLFLAVTSQLFTAFLYKKFYNTMWYINFFSPPIKFNIDKVPWFLPVMKCWKV